jgi:hypothetical protein
MQDEARMLIATIGLHGSASTWVFNVVRELMIASYGSSQVRSLYTEEVGDLPAHRADMHQIIKSHHGSKEFDAWLASVAPKILLSVRDPRDASISMSKRFNVKLEVAVRWITSDCRRLMNFSGETPLLRYEDRFFDQPATVSAIANWLALQTPPGTMASIFDRYATAAMRAMAQTVSDSSAQLDRVTQIHRGHIGDTRSGKWLDLPEPVATAVTRHFEPFLKRFGYPERPPG